MKKIPREPTAQEIKFGGKDAGVLERFMKEFFPFTEFKKIGFFTPEMKGDYYAQAARVCQFFAFESVFEYGAQEIRCHISYGNDDKAGFESDESGGFITVIKSIYE